MIPLILAAFVGIAALLNYNSKPHPLIVCTDRMDDLIGRTYRGQEILIDPPSCNLSNEPYKYPGDVGLF